MARSLTVLAPIRPGGEERLRESLRAIGDDIKGMAGDDVFIVAWSAAVAIAEAAADAAASEGIACAVLDLRTLPSSLL